MNILPLEVITAGPGVDLSNHQPEGLAIKMADPVADFDFDGVAVSADGVNRYEAQDLRHLRSDRFTAFDLDLDAVVSALGLSYGAEFRVRFCQVDDNPAPMDGIFLQGIVLTAELTAPVFHLAMDDNAASPTVSDSTARTATAPPERWTTSASTAGRSIWRRLHGFARCDISLGNETRAEPTTRIPAIWRFLRSSFKGTLKHA